MSIVFELDFYVLKAGGSLRLSPVTLHAADERCSSAEWWIILSTEKATKQMQRAETMLHFVAFWHTFWTHELCGDNTESLF